MRTPLFSFHSQPSARQKVFPLSGKPFFLLILIAWLPLMGQSPITETTPKASPIKVTVLSDGLDVRSVLCSVFSQAQKSFVTEPGLSLTLYLNLHEVPFETAVDLICQSAGITYEIDGEVYHFFRKVRTARRSPSTPSPQVSQPVEAKPLDPSVLDRIFTSKLSNVDLRTAIKEISRKTNVPIQVAPDVKNLKVNATFLETSLRYALNSLCQAGKLMYTFTSEGTILISDPTHPPTSLSASTQTAPNLAKIARCDQCQAELGKGWKYCPHCGNYVKPLTEGG